MFTRLQPQPDKKKKRERTPSRKEEGKKNIRGDLADASLREHPFHGDYSLKRRRRCAFLSSLLRTQFPRAAAWRKDTFSFLSLSLRSSARTVFHNKPVYLEQRGRKKKKEKKQVVRSSSRRHCILFVEWEFAIRSSKTQKKQNQKE